MTSAFGLRHWANVAARREWPTLLLGNGASRAMSGLFEYKSLYGVAPLSADDKLLFDALNTRDFEEVLEHLRVARLCAANSVTMTVKSPCVTGAYAAH